MRRLHATKVFVFDDQPNACTSLSCLLSREGYETSFLAANDALDEKLLAVARDQSILLLAARVRGTDCVELCKKLFSADPIPPTILVADRKDFDMALAGLRIGACDLLVKPFTARELLDALERASHRPLPSGCSAHLAARLTPREIEVLNLMMTGRRTKEIARLLDISPRTVESHRASIYRKTGAEGMGDLLRIARS